jgi:hypothetical protein
MAGNGSRLSLKATSPQDEYVSLKGPFVSETPILQHTDFSIDQIRIPFGIKPYLGSTQKVKIEPKSFQGDLLSNMHLIVKLPQLRNGATYTNNVGRALIKSFTLYVNEQEIEKITSDWLVIRDEIFLDDDEKTGMSQLMNSGFNVNDDTFKQNYSINPKVLDIIIPLEFFFCRRHSPYKKKNERTNKPFFPICAILNQKIYVEVEFYPQVYFTNTTDTIDLAEQATLVIESITLTEAERAKYMDSDIDVIINKVYKEPINELKSAFGRFNITVNFPVTITTWFFRRKTFERSITDFFDKHYNYGYTYTDNSLYKNKDPFKYISMFLNNHEVTPNINGKNFFKYLQPINYGLSTPTNEIYMYCFGTNPKEYNIGGSFDFSKVESKTSYINFYIDDAVATDIKSNYTFNMYHYGYNLLKFSEGSVSLAFL